jgi:hypothetical protein
MLTRGFLFSSQLYVMWPHTEMMVNAMAAALDESLVEVTRLHAEGRLQTEAGPMPASTGFARLV